MQCARNRIGLALVWLMAWTAAFGAGYRYRDADGRWVYTDRPPADGRSVEGLVLGGTAGASPKVTVVARSSPAGVALVAVNECRCAVEFAVRAEAADGVRSARQVVPAGSEVVLLDVATQAAP